MVGRPGTPICEKVGICGGAGKRAVLVLRLDNDGSMGRVSGLYLVDMVLDSGDLESLEVG